MTNQSRTSPQATSYGVVVLADPRLWWPALATRGGLAVLFGILAVVWPGVTVLALAVLFGVFAAVDGVWQLVTAYRHGRRRTANWKRVLGHTVGGAAAIALAVITLFWPHITVLILAILAGAWALVTGIAQLVVAVRLRKEIRWSPLYIVGGVLSIVAGLLLMIWPDIGARAIAMVLGIFALLYGAMMVALAWRLRNEANAAVVP